MQVRYENEVANHLGPESCVGRREAGSEALTGETTGQPSSREIISPGLPTLYGYAEGDTEQGVNRKPCDDPARSKTLSMSGSFLHRNWEVSTVPGSSKPGGAGKGNRKPRHRRR